MYKEYGYDNMLHISTIGQEFLNRLSSGDVVNLFNSSNSDMLLADGSISRSKIKDLTVNTITITAGGYIRHGKANFNDSTNAGWFFGPEGIYVGSASDASKLRYNFSDGTFDFIGTVSSRATSALASAINSSANLITDVINAKLDTSSKNILSDFNFGSTNYAGAVKSGDITWDTDTGAITGGSGIIVYRSGIVGASSGITTFSIDATTGNATFAGSLVAAAGTLGSLEITTSGNIRGGQTAYDTGTGFWLGYDTSTYKLSLGNSSGDKLLWTGTALEITGNIVGSTVTGGTIQTAASGQRVIISGVDNRISFYDSSGGNASIYQSTTFGLVIQPNSGVQEILMSGQNVRVNNRLLANGLTENVDIGSSATNERFRTIYLVNSPDVSSARELKKNIKPLEYGVIDLMKVEPVSFERKDDPDKKRIGFIAEDLQKVIPEASSGKSIQPDNLIPVMIKSIQDLYNIIGELSQKVDNLEQQLNN